MSCAYVKQIAVCPHLCQHKNFPSRNLAEMRRNIADIRFFARNFFVKTGDVGTKKTPLLKY